MKTKNKLLTVTLMIIILINTVIPIANAVTCSIGKDIRLQGYGSVECHVRNKENGDYAITTDLVGYYNGGKFFPAYCLNRGYDGAGNDFIHTVNVSQILADEETYNKIWRVVTAGYPYKSAAELGVDDWTYAYQATKTAIYDILGQTDVNNYYGIDETGKRTVELMKKLVNEGENGTATYKTPIATIKKSGDIFLEDDEYVQNYTVTSNVGMEAFTVSVTGVPSKATVTNSKGEKANSFKSGEIFQIRVPKEILEDSKFWARISVGVQTKSYPIFYGKTYDSKLQNYAITADRVTLTNVLLDETYDIKTASIKIRKIDKDTKQPLSGVVYQLINKDTGSRPITKETDENGFAEFDKLAPGNYVIQEIKTADNYVISQEAIDVKAIYNETVEITLENELKKGKIKILKVDSENNELCIPDAVFEIYNSNGEVVDTLKTNNDGEAISKSLPINEKYVIKEVKSNDEYVLSEKTVTVTLEENEIEEITFENMKKYGKLKINKISGKYNKILNLPENSPLANAKFLITNENGETIGTYTTDETGSILIEKLPCGKYTIYEYETPAYFLKDAEPKTISITENNQIIEITFTNMPIEPELPKTGF